MGGGWPALLMQHRNHTSACRRFGLAFGCRRRGGKQTFDNESSSTSAGIPVNRQGDTLRRSLDWFANLAIQSCDGDASRSNQAVGRPKLNQDLVRPPTRNPRRNAYYIRRHLACGLQIAGRRTCREKETHTKDSNRHCTQDTLAFCVRNGSFTPGPLLGRATGGS